MALIAFTLATGVVIQVKADVMSVTIQTILCLYPPWASLFAVRAIAMSQATTGIHFSNWGNTHVGTENMIAPRTSLLMIFAEVFVYAAIAYCIPTIDNLFRSVSNRDWSSSSMVEGKGLDGFTPLIETRPGDEHPALKIRDLKKRFGKHWAVDGISLDLFNSDVTILLGQNGAGKSTLVGQDALH